jgi:hypothetical protein
LFLIRQAHLPSPISLAREKRCDPTLRQRVASLLGLRGGTRAVTRSNGGIADVADIRSWAPPPETADELCDVAHDLGVDPTTHLYLGAAATETKVKQLSENGTLAKYKIVHFATHGAVAGQVSRASEPGLLLTPPDKASEADDGYLSASEIAGLKLDADGVILSAYNTAAGGAQGAEALSEDHEELVRNIREQIRGPNPGVVTIDTLNRSLVGSESSDEDVAAYIRAVDAIQPEFDCVVIIIHHCGVDATRPREHTSLTGAVDAQLSCKRDAANNVVVEVEYMKDGKEGDIICSSLKEVEVGVDADGDKMRTCVIEPVDAALTTSVRGKLTGKHELAMRMLYDALVERGIALRPFLGDHQNGEAQFETRSSAVRSQQAERRWPRLEH